MAKGLKKFILALITTGPFGLEADPVEDLYFADKDEAKKLTTEDAMKVFTAAFTHKSANPDPYGNYEIYEYQGDRVLKTALSQFLFTLLSEQNKVKISESLLSTLEAYWQSGIPYSEFSLTYKFSDFIISKERGDSKDQARREDVFEAFFGALFTNARTYLSLGRAYELCFGIFNKIMKQQKIELDESKLKSKVSQLKELFQSYYGVDKLIFTKREVKEAGLVIVKYHDYNNLPLPEGRDKNETLAKEKAAENAIKELAKRGITPQTAKVKKEERTMGLVLRLEQANKKLEQSPIKYLPLTEASLVAQDSRGGSDYVNGLFATDAKTEKQVLISKGVGTSWQSASLKALDNFIEGKNEILTSEPAFVRYDKKTSESNEYLNPISSLRNASSSRSERGSRGGRGSRGEFRGSRGGRGSRGEFRGSRGTRGSRGRGNRRDSTSEFSEETPEENIPIEGDFD